MHSLISEDTKIHNEYKLVIYLYQCFVEDKDIVIDFHLEGPCCSRNNLYNILDEFCNATKFNKSRIKIYTGNALERHSEYEIIFKPEYWYEIKLINDWLKNNRLNIDTKPLKHFGIFIGRSSWSRLWASTILYRYKDKTLQTFHSGYDQNYVVSKSNNTTDFLELDELNRFRCDIIPEVTQFLNHCPINQINDLDVIKNTKMFIAANNNYCFPIQHPANLNILKWYNDICIDVICETRTVGNVFFVTEKTWRCIIAKKPFIIVGAPHFLNNLKKLGFKTFNDYWNEGYDEYPPSHRIKEIEKLINTLAKKPIIEMHNLLTQMQPTLEHNYQTFVSLTYNKIQEIFNE